MNRLIWIVFLWILVLGWCRYGHAGKIWWFCFYGKNEPWPGECISELSWETWKTNYTYYIILTLECNENFVVPGEIWTRIFRFLDRCFELIELSSQRGLVASPPRQTWILNHLRVYLLSKLKQTVMNLEILTRLFAYTVARYKLHEKKSCSSGNKFGSHYQTKLATAIPSYLLKIKSLLTFRNNIL